PAGRARARGCDRAEQERQREEREEHSPHAPVIGTRRLSFTARDARGAKTNRGGRLAASVTTSRLLRLLPGAAGGAGALARRRAAERVRAVDVGQRERIGISRGTRRD